MKRLAVPLALAALAGLVAALVLLRHRWPAQADGAPDEFTRWMQTGKNYLDRAEAAKAAEAFQKAVLLRPVQPDARVNLANAWLLQNQCDQALQQAQEALALDRNQVAAYYVLGCANLRLARYEPAIQAFQLAINLDPTVAAAQYQLGRAHLEAGHLEEAISAFQEAVELQPDHPAAHYNLSQALVRDGRKDEAAKALELHQQIKARQPNLNLTMETLERCKHTAARLPFKAEQPAQPGVPVTFVETTSTAFGRANGRFHGPVGILDFNHDGRNSLWVGEGDGFRLLANSNGVFQPHGPLAPGVAGARYRRCLVGDLQNDRFEDIVVLGERASHVFKFATNGLFTEVTAYCGLRGLAGMEGALADLDFTGALDLLAISPSNGSVQVFRNLKNFYFKDITATSGIPATVTGVRQLAVEDWNHDDLNDLWLARNGQPPALLSKLRGGAWAQTNSPGPWPAGGTLAVGDLNNDLRNDVVVATPQGNLELVFNGLSRQLRYPCRNAPLNELALVDYDNDGWLDIVAAGDGLRLWRNLGENGFVEVTGETGLQRLVLGRVASIHPADFDSDGDTDLLLTLENGDLKLLNNQGGNAHHQLKLRLAGNRSNASGLGVHLEVAVGGLRLARTISRLPVEIGIGRHRQVDAVTVGWFDLTLSTVDLPAERKPIELPEIYFPKGSCPYLYAWTGDRFDFVSDFLGNAPLGLRINATRFVEADPDEHLWLGDERRVKPRNGQYLVQLTEELSEVLYLDEAKLVVVDHPPGTVAHPTTKMRPGRPFPPSELRLLHRPYPLIHGARSDGREVTDLLARVDGRMVSPVKLRAPQLRGLCEPYSVTLNFGPLPTERPLVLAMTGWIKFGGGMANVAASHCPELPFPFPLLEAESAGGTWQPVDVTVGVPSGKTKTILVDLAGQLPASSRRLRLTTAYEIHWDAVGLYERAASNEARTTTLSPAKADLHWRGYSVFEDRPAWQPLTPDYARVRPTAPWRAVPSGWCTRYGEVGELLAARDNALVLINGGDELTLAFAADRLPVKPEGWERDFFLFAVGWDKDTDFHVECGTTVEPLPWHGLDEQLYGRQPRPFTGGDALMKQYNTRWVGPYLLDRAARK